MRFNTQPPEGGWVAQYQAQQCGYVSTHSRPKAAGCIIVDIDGTIAVSTHSRPKAAGGDVDLVVYDVNVSTHSRPKAAGHGIRLDAEAYVVSTHSRPKAAGKIKITERYFRNVSTHSRPKAAGASLKSLAPSGFAAPISPSSQEKREREYNTAFSVTPAFAIS